MNRKGFILMMSLVCMTLWHGVVGQEFVPIDPRSKGMGNAGVALSEGPGASYWNPANLALGTEELFEFKGFGNTNTAFLDLQVHGDALAEADELADLITQVNLSDIQDSLNTGTATAGDLQDAIRVIEQMLDLGEEGVGALGDLGGSIDLKLGNFAIFYRQLGHAGIDTVLNVDPGDILAFSDGGFSEVFAVIGTGNTPTTSAGQTLSSRLQSELGMSSAEADELAYQAEQAVGAALSDPSLQDALVNIAAATIQNTGGSSTNTLYYNESGVEFRGIRLHEIGISYGMPLIPGEVLAGITLKGMVGETFYSRVTIKDIVDGEDLMEDLLEEFDENRKESTRFSIDAGFSFLPAENICLSLTGKNLIPVDFDFEGPGDYELDPMVRLGIGIRVTEWLKVGADVDVTENVTEALEGFESRILGAGFEISPPLGPVDIKLRGGIFENIAAESGPVYTTSVGLRLFKFLYLDANAQLSVDTIDIEKLEGTGTEDVPERVSGSAMIGFDITF